MDMKNNVGMAIALVCIALLIGIIAALLSGWLARRTGVSPAGCVIRAAGAFAVTVGMMLAIFTFLGLGP
ncbi:hypothetical protein ACWGKW_40785 [Streptomyces sp. NPDC054766]